MEGVVQGLAVLALAWAAAATAQAAAPHYRIQTLPEQPGVTDVYLFDINNEGLAVGTRYLRSEGRSEGFTYRAGVTQLLPTLGARSSNAWGLNERGDVIGSMDISDTESRAFIYRGGRFIDVPPPPNNEEGTHGLVDINNLGHVVAVGRDASVHHFSPFIFDGAKSYFLKIPEEFHVEDPSALNDRDEVVGTTVHHRAYYYHDGKSLLLPQPGDQFPTPYYSMSGVDINNPGLFTSAKDNDEPVLQ